MFAEIAPSYDRLNHLLSINVDRLWRRFTVKKLKDALSRPGALALDLCCGTADLTLELEKHAPSLSVYETWNTSRAGWRRFCACSNRADARRRWNFRAP